MNKKIASILLIISGLTLSLTAQASFVIDDFTDDTAFLAAPDSETTVTLLGSDFSSSRFIEITEAPDGPGGASAIIINGKLGVSTGFRTGSDTTSLYSNTDGFDFTLAEVEGAAFNNAFIINLLSIDQGGVNITLTINGVSSSQFVNSAIDVVFNHSLFNDVSAVNEIALLIHNNIAVDATFDSFQSFGQAPSAVPLPGALLLLSTAIAMLGFTRLKT